MRNSIAFIEVSLAASNLNQMSSGVEALKICQELGYQTVVVTQSPDFYGPLIHSFVDEWRVCDTRDEQTIVATLRHTPLQAVLTFSDLFVEVAARVAQTLGLLTASPGSPAVQRNKAAVRQALDQAHIPNPCWTVANAVDSINTSPLGYPCIVKPIDGSASWDVRRVDNDSDLQEVIHRHLARSDYGRNVLPKRILLFEEELKGPLFSAEGFSLRSRAYIWGYSDRLLIHPPFFVEARSTFSGREPCQTIQAFLNSILEATDYNFGPFHIEFMLTEQGPMLVEFNPRLIGGNAHSGIDLSCDASVIKYIILNYVGKRPDDLFARRASTQRDIYLDSNGQIKAIRGREQAQRVPGVVNVTLWARPGDRVRYATSNSDALGYLSTVDDTPEAATQCAEKALQYLEIEVQ